jgi:hypothetical protein
MTKRSQKPDPQERFIDEFLVDRDAHAAALRVGVSRITVKRQVQVWMADEHILQEIKRRTDESDLKDMITPQRIIAGWIDIAFDKNATHAARNTALRELAEIYDMYPEDKDPGDDNVRGVMLVPFGTTQEEWEKMAIKSQRKLKEDVRK